MLYGSVHEILVHIELASIEGSNESANMCSLVSAFSASIHK